MTPVMTRTLWAQRRAMVGWMVGVVALGLVTTGSWPAVADSTDDLQQVMENLPPALAAFFGEGIADFSAAGVIGSRLFGTIGLVLFIGFAISRGARAIAGEEEQGTLELLVTQPLSRRVIAADKVLATWLALAALVVVQLVLLLLMQPLVGLDFGIGRIVGASIGLYLLSAMFGMLAFALGAATGNRSLAVGVSAAVAAGLFVLSGFGQLVPAIETIADRSPFARFDGTLVLVSGIDGPAVVSFGVAATLLVAAGVVAFEHRDLS